MEIEKYKTFGELKVGDKIIAVDVTTNDKNVFKVLNIKPRKDCYIVEFVTYGIAKPNPFCTYDMILNVDDYVTSRDGKKWISDAKNADKIIECVKSGYVSKYSYEMKIRPLLVKNLMKDYMNLLKEVL
mgnify:CR=1 FL=1